MKFYYCQGCMHPKTNTNSLNNFSILSFSAPFMCVLRLYLYLKSFFIVVGCHDEGEDTCPIRYLISLFDYGSGLLGCNALLKSVI